MHIPIGSSEKVANHSSREKVEIYDVGFLMSARQTVQSARRGAKILLRNIESGAVNTKRELYYIAKGECKHNKRLKPLDFSDQTESDSIVDFICELLEVDREEVNCFANDRGGQTYSQNLVVTENLTDGTKANIDLSSLGTTPFQPKNRPQSFTLKPKKGKVDFCLQ